MSVRKIQGVLSEAQHALKGDYPDVPLAEGVVLAELTEGDDNPMFISLPIAFVATSRNQVNYAEKDVIRIVNAVNTRNVVGNLGHLPEWERPYTFDIPPLRWVGATYVADTRTAWGKAYVLPTARDVRDYIRASKGANAEIGTSIYGTAEIDGDGNIVGETLELENIDLAHPKRVGMPMAARIPLITQETVQPDTVSESTEEKSMDPKTQTKPQEATQGVLSELEKSLQEQVAQLENRVRELTIEATQNTPKLNAYNAIFDMVGKPEDGDVQLAVQARLLELDALKRENLTLLESAMQLAIAEKVVAEQLRPIILEMVKAEKPASKSDMVVAVQKVLAKESVKAMLKATTLAEMGPPQQRPVVPNGDNEFPYFAFPEDK